MSEYRVIWQREGRTKQRRICQTAPGALREAERQRTAADEIEWADPPIPPLVFGPEIEVRMTTPTKATLYVFAAPHGVKVGVTTGRVELRRAYVEAACGQPVTYVFAVEYERAGIRVLERQVHEALCEHRTHGEWFACQPEVAVQAVRNAVSGSDAALPDPAELPSPEAINALVARGVQPELAALRLLGGRATSRQIASALLERPPTIGETVSIGRRLHGLHNRSYLRRDGAEWVLPDGVLA